MTALALRAAAGAARERGRRVSFANFRLPHSAAALLAQAEGKNKTSPEEADETLVRQALWA